MNRRPQQVHRTPCILPIATSTDRAGVFLDQSRKAQQAPSPQELKATRTLLMRGYIFGVSSRTIGSCPALLFSRLFVSLVVFLQ